MRLLTKAVPEGQAQRAAVLDLLAWQLREVSPALVHRKDGKPRLRDYPDLDISISHCLTDVAVLIGRQEKPGVDVEGKWAQAERLKERFCTPAELGLSQETGLEPIWFWCAKEACFKAHSDILVTPWTSVRVTGLGRGDTLEAEVSGFGTVQLGRLVLPSGAALVYTLSS